MSKNQQRVFDTHSQPTSYQYRIFLVDAFRENEEMIEGIKILESASPNDVVKIYINTLGGRVDAALMMRNAILNSRATTIAYCSGTVASAGTMVMFAADEVDVAPFTSFVFHSSSAGFWGNAATIKEDVDFYHSWNNDLIRGIYGGFFTEEEYQQMLVNGKDLRLTDKEFLLRYAELIELLSPKELTKEMLSKVSKGDLIDIILGHKEINTDTGEVYLV